MVERIAAIGASVYAGAKPSGQMADYCGGKGWCGNFAEADPGRCFGKDIFGCPPFCGGKILNSSGPGRFYSNRKGSLTAGRLRLIARCRISN